MTREEATQAIGEVVESTGNSARQPEDQRSQWRKKRAVEFLFMALTGYEPSDEEMVDMLGERL